MRPTRLVLGIIAVQAAATAGVATYVSRSGTVAFIALGLFGAELVNLAVWYLQRRGKRGVKA